MTMATMMSCNILWRTRALWISAIFLVAVATSTSALSTSFTKILPLKAAMLTKSWQGLLKDVDQKVGIVPELGGTSVGVKRFGPELKRRTLCARQFERFFESSFALATADKTDDAQAKRLAIPSLLIDGQARGPFCNTFASLTAPATISMVEQLEDEWSVLSLTVNPEERVIDLIVAAELTMLTELHALRLASNSSASLRVHHKVMETLAGNCEQLGLAPIVAHDDGSLNEEEPIWLRCNF